MISRQEVLQSIQLWQSQKSNFQSLEELFSTFGYFHIQSDFYQWFLEFQDNKEFVAQLGILNNELILIPIPMDASGNEVILDSYWIQRIKSFSGDLILEETKTTVETNKLVLKNGAEIQRVSDISQPFDSNSNLISPELAATEIINWNSLKYDWLFQQSKLEEESNLIANKFYVPFENIEFNLSFQNIFVFFALKSFLMYSEPLMTLIFVSELNSTDKQISGSIHTSYTSNSSNFARPCPPFCRIK